MTSRITASHSRQYVAAPPARPNRKKLLLVVALSAILIISAATLLYDSMASTQDKPRLKSQEQLAALPDGQMEAMIINDLAQRLAYPQYTPDGWKRLPPVARTVWIVNSLEEPLRDRGWSVLIAGRSRPTGEPGIDDARSAYEEIGLSERAELLDHVARTLDSMPNGTNKTNDLAALLKQYVALLNKPDGRKVWLSYLRKHLSDLTSP